MSTANGVLSTSRTNSADRAGTNDGEFGVSRHELVLSTMWGFWIIAALPYSIYPLSEQ